MESLTEISTFWHPNGLVRRTGNFVHGKRDGIWTRWGEWGDVLSQSRFVQNAWVEYRIARHMGVLIRQMPPHFHRASVVEQRNRPHGAIRAVVE